jgi:hypothetical protein
MKHFLPVVLFFVFSMLQAQSVNSKDITLDFKLTNGEPTYTVNYKTKLSCWKVQWELN